MDSRSGTVGNLPPSLRCRPAGPRDPGPRALSAHMADAAPSRASSAPRRGLLARHAGALVMLVLALVLLGAARPGRSLAAEPSLRLSAEERAWLAGHRRLRVATKLDWSPIDLYGYEGRFRGLSGDYLHRVGRILGVEFEFLALPTLADGLRALRDGRADIVPSVSRTAEREGYMRFAGPYLDVSNVYLARRGVGPVGEAETMSGLRIAAERGYAVVDTIRERHPLALVVTVDDSASALRAVSEGRADAYMGALSTTTFLVERLLLANLEIRGPWRTDLSALHLGVRAEDAILQSILDKALAAITLAERQEIHRRWVPVRHLLASPAPPLPMSAEEIRLVEDTPALRVGFDEAHAPYTFRGADGAFSGMARDYLDLVLRRTGLSIGATSGADWSQVYDAARTGEIDLLVAVSANDDRRREFLFVGPWISAPAVLVSRRDRPHIDGVRRLAGRSIAVLADGQHAALLAASHPGVRAVGYPTRDALLAAVSRGEVDGAVTNLSFAVPRLREGLGAALRIDGVYPELSTDLYFAVRRDQPQIAALLARALASITDDERAGVASRWTSVDVDAGLSAAQWARRAAPYAAVLVAALLVSLAWAVRLRREVRRATAAEAGLARARDRAESLARAREEFVSIASHEIRTPANAVAGALSLMRGQPDGPRREELLALAERSVAMLRRFIDNLLDLSRSDAGQLRLHLERVDLRRALREPLLAIGAALARPGVAFSFDVDPQVAPRMQADPLRVAQVLVNLVANALRATSAGKVSVAVSVAAHEPGAQRLRFVVADTGEGVPADLVPRLFDRYATGAPVHGASPAAASAGTGLGLYLSQRLVEAMGGRIVVDSAPGEGTRMTFELRLEVEATDDPGSGGGSPDATMARSDPCADGVEVAAGERRVLVVDDNRVQQMLLSSAFAARGCAVDLADDGAEALAAWRRHRHPVVLSDCRMPGVDGPTFARELRALPGGGAVSLIAMSADADDAERARAAGMDRFFVKPVRDDVIDEIAERLRGRPAP